MVSGQGQGQWSVVSGQGGQGQGQWSGSVVRVRVRVSVCGGLPLDAVGEPKLREQVRVLLQVVHGEGPRVAAGAERRSGHGAVEGAAARLVRARVRLADPNPNHQPNGAVEGAAARLDPLVKAHGHTHAQPRPRKLGGAHLVRVRARARARARIRVMIRVRVRGGVRIGSGEG